MTHIAIHEALNGKPVDWMERSATNNIGADRDQRSQITDQNHWLSVIWV